MNDDSVIGPGMGTLIGMKWAEVGERASAQSRDLAGLRQELRRRQDVAYFDQAFALAASDVMAAVLAELRGEKPRHLSDPAARAARNDMYVKRAASHVVKASGGKTILAPADQKRIAANQPLK